MDFLERWLRVSPDGGNGSFEAAAILAALIAVYILVFRGGPGPARYKRMGIAEAICCREARPGARISRWQALQSIWR